MAPDNFPYQCGLCGVVHAGEQPHLEIVVGKICPQTNC
jgi:hypothetical protein